MNLKKASLSGPSRYAIKCPMIKMDNLDRWSGPLGRATASMAAEKVLDRILAGDWTVWKPEDVGISDRLGWLAPLPDARTVLPVIESFAGGVRRDGILRVLLLGMGGSSLAPEVYGRARRTGKGFPRLDILDTTAPDAVARVLRGLDVKKTLFIVSSKSGTTAEMSALFNCFYALVCDRLGKKNAGRHFAAITDPGSRLEEIARRHGFRRIFSGNPTVGGRFSALTVFGLVPAVLCGYDIRGALDRSEPIMEACRSTDPETNPAAVLGTILGVLAGRGVNKATFLVPSAISSLGSWLEQLIAESTGKEGKGILPVLEDNPGRPAVYGRDRVFIHVRHGNLDPFLETGRRLAGKGFPIVSVISRDSLSLPGLFYLWEMATAVAGHHMGINPFDQPNVESTKKKTREALKMGTEGAVAGAGTAKSSPSPSDALKAVLARPRAGEYIALQAFLDPTPGTRKALETLKDALRDRTGLPVTLGFGPRYLHSTGQLHKGDNGRGIFVQIVGRERADVPIPEVDGARPAGSFGALFSAQSLGDWEALREAGRRVARIDLGADILEGLRTLANAASRL
jgi:glucose-6-phosphate isomerase